jgi:hypothetical protein
MGSLGRLAPPSAIPFGANSVRPPRRDGPPRRPLPGAALN